MNRQQLVDAVGERLGDRRTAAVAVEAVLDTVTGALADGQRVALFGFGVFERVDRPARTARNPATGGTVQVPATAVPRFRAGQGLKDAVNGRSSGAAAATRKAGAAEATGSAARPQVEATGGSKTDGTAKAGKGKADKGKADKGKAGKGKAGESGSGKNGAAKGKAAKNGSGKGKADTSGSGRSAKAKGSGKADEKG